MGSAVVYDFQKGPLNPSRWRGTATRPFHATGFVIARHHSSVAVLALMRTIRLAPNGSSFNTGTTWTLP